MESIEDEETERDKWLKDYQRPIFQNRPEEEAT